MLSRLPVRLLELVLQHLSFAEQLLHDSHLSTQLTCPTAVSLHHAWRLSDDTFWHVSQRPALIDKLTGATSIAVDIEQEQSPLMRFVLSASEVDRRFPRLERFSYRGKCVAEVGFEGELAVASNGGTLRSFLSARSSTLRCLHLDVWMSSTEFEELIAVLPQLRHVRLANTGIHASCLVQLLALPLDVLDLGESTLRLAQAELKTEPPSSVKSCALLQSCRVLRLPRPSSNRMSNPWLTFLDTILEGRESCARPHTLSLRHYPSAGAVAQLMTKPPQRLLSMAGLSSNMHVTALKACPAELLSCSDALQRLHLTIECGTFAHQWLDSAFIRTFGSRLRSITLDNLPPYRDSSREILTATSHCINLQSLSISTTNSYRTHPPAIEQQWAQQPLARLHTIHLSGMRAGKQHVGRLLSLCPSLRVCVLKDFDFSAYLLDVLARSCPQLRHLQLLGLFRTSVEDDQPNPSSQPFQLGQPFPSLTRLDMLYFAAVFTPEQLCSHLLAVHSLVKLSPLRHLTFAHTLSTEQRTVVLQHLPALSPSLESLTMSGSDAVIRSPLRPPAVWSDEILNDLDEVEVSGQVVEDGRPIPPLTADESAPFEVPNSARPHRTLRSLDLVIEQSVLPVEQFQKLLRLHGAAVTSVKLTIRGRSKLVIILLRCLAYIGMHCPLIECITFTLESLAQGGRPRDMTATQVVRAPRLVDSIDMPDRAFACLRYLRQVGTDTERMIDEVAEHVKQKWFRAARRDVILSWHGTHDGC